jgi:SpoVK/Ycf46/Vps4 family AAA+-type ATPase
MSEDSNSDVLIISSSSESDSDNNNKRKKRSRWDEASKRLKTEPPTITTIFDLIEFAGDLDPNVFFDRFSLDTLFKILPSLVELNKLIGMEELKKDVLQMVLYYLQKLDSNDDMLHTVIYGTSGCGKSTAGRILADIYAHFGFVTPGKFRIVSRTDFIAKYLGQTAHRTRNLLEECKNGVMFIDEAYSLASGNSDHDTYSKEALDTLNTFLSEHKKDFVCIIAGYEEDLNKTFFSVNQGLQRRFPWRFKIEKYSPAELRQIFIKLVYDADWGFLGGPDEVVDVKFFEENKEYFDHAGGDMESLFAKIKIKHTFRMFGHKATLRKYIITEDITNGFELFKQHKIEQKNAQSKPPPFMYT